ncbi:MAG: tRNA dihydrouridine synthase DusB [Chlamydiota bacterium]
MFYLGNCPLPSNIFCAPLAGCSDFPFRKMTKYYQPGLIYCEMVKMDALIRNDLNTYRLLDFETDMHPIGAQLCGSKLQLAGPCAKIIEDLGFDVVDLNCGCPVDKVTKDGSGSGLLKNPDLIGDLISNMVASVKIPVTVKIRIGWDFNQINCTEIVSIAEKAGAKAICIHGRTRSQGYKGPANWDYIRACKETAKTIKVIGNGDVMDAKSALALFEATGCDAILVARGTMGQPWITEDIYRALAGEVPLTRTFLDYKQAVFEHFQHIVSYQNEKKAVTDMRRVGCFYLKSGKGARKLREALNKSKSTAEIHQLLIQYPWEEIDFTDIESSDLESEPVPVERIQ